MEPVTVYTTDFCRYCTAVKALLEARSVPYREVNLERDIDGRVKLAQRTGVMTFPQVLVGETLVGGFEETRAAVASGLLDELLESARASAA